MFIVCMGHHYCIDALQVSPCKGAKEESKVLIKRAVEKEVDASKSPSSDGETNCVKARTFTYAELLAAMQNFKAEFFLREGGFGKVYRGHLQDTNEIVAIKQLDRNGCQGIRGYWSMSSCR